MYPSFCFLIDMIMSFWVFISQCAESSNKSSIVHNPGEGSRALESTRVSRNNYCFKRRYFLTLDFSATIEFFFPIYLVASAYNKLRQDEILFTVNRNEWTSPNVLEWHNISCNDGSRIVFLVGKMKRKLCTRYLQKNTPELWFLDFKFWGDGSVHFYADRSTPMRNMFDHSGDDLLILKTDLFTPTVSQFPIIKCFQKKKKLIHRPI